MRPLYRRNPALDGITPDAFFDIILGKMPPQMSAILEQYRSAFVPRVVQILEEERALRAAPAQTQQAALSLVEQPDEQPPQPVAAPAPVPAPELVVPTPALPTPPPAVPTEDWFPKGRPEGMPVALIEKPYAKFRLYMAHAHYTPEGEANPLVVGTSDHRSQEAAQKAAQAWIQGGENLKGPAAEAQSKGLPPVEPHEILIAMTTLPGYRKARVRYRRGLYVVVDSTGGNSPFSVIHAPSGATVVFAKDRMQAMSFAHALNRLAPEVGKYTPFGWAPVGADKENLQTALQQLPYIRVPLASLDAETWETAEGTTSTPEPVPVSAPAPASAPVPEPAAPRPARAPRTPRGPQVSRAGEVVTDFTPEEAEAAVISMAWEMADLPPPPTMSKGDDVGLSVSTNGPIRHFLDNAEAGLATREDYLHAARLLITHSKTQLSRADVMGAVRALETSLPTEEPLPAHAQGPRKEDYRIVDPRKGEYQEPGIGTTGWRWAGGDRAVLQLPGVVPYGTAAALVPGARMVNEGGSTRLDVPVRELGPLLAYLTNRGAGEGAARLEQAARAWVRHGSTTEHTDDAPRPVTPAAPASPPTSATEVAPWPDAFIRNGSFHPSRGNQDFNSVWWEWDGGGTVRLAFSWVSSFSPRGGGGKGEPGSRIVDRYLTSMGRPAGIKDKETSIPGTRYTRYWFRYPVGQVATVADGLVRAYGTAANDYKDEFKALGQYWSDHADVTAPAEPLKVPASAAAGLALDPNEGTLVLRQGDFSWNFDPTRNAVGLKFPYDSSQGRDHQIFAALREEGLPHRREGYWLYLRTPQVSDLITFLGKQGRFPDAIPTLQKLLPYWQQEERANAPKVTEQDRKQAAALLRRFRATMDNEDAEYLNEHLDPVAPYLRNIEPGTRGVDLGPFGKWAIVDTKMDAKGNMGADLRIYLDGLGSLSKLAGYGAADSQGVWYQPFPLTRVEEITRGLDKIAREARHEGRNLDGLYALALTIRAATLIDERGVDCPIRNELADVHNLDQIQDPEVRARVERVAATVASRMAPGVSLREYQQIAVAFAQEAGYRALIGDAMGLGKTPTAIGILLSDPARLLPALVVAPAAVAGSWPGQITKFAPHLRVVSSVTRDGKDKTAKAALLSALKQHDWDILIVPWTTLRLAKDELIAAAHDQRIRTVIYDEVHRAKNAKAQQSNVAREIAHAVKGGRIFLTGTLISNDTSEAWHPLMMLNPVTFGDPEEFKERFSTKGGAKSVVYTDKATGKTIKRLYRARDRSGTRAEEREQELQELRRALRCDMIRRLKTEVLAEMPPKTRMFDILQLPPEASDAFQVMVETLVGWLCASCRYIITSRATEMRKRGDYSGSPMQAVQDYVLSKVPPPAGAPKGWTAPLSDTNLAEGVRAILGTLIMVAYGALRRGLAYLKAPEAAAAILSHMEDDPNPVVVFGIHKRVINTLVKAFEDAGKKVARIDGSTPADKRNAIKDAFQAGEYDVIVGSSAMGIGIDLTRADHVFFVEPWSNPSDMEQAEDRIHRADDLTMAKTGVFAHHLVVPGTIDDNLLVMLNEKRKIVAGVLGAESTEVQGDRAIDPIGYFSGLIKKIGESDRVQGVLGCMPTSADVQAMEAGTYPKPKRLEDLGFGADDNEDKAARAPNADARTNPARASRTSTYEHPSLTPEHFTREDVRKATLLAERARKEGTFIGSGNFGKTYRLGNHVVKFPQEKDMHGRPWPLGEIRKWLMHEAGVANELAEAGSRLAPLTVYVELADGTPALVREYGEPLKTITVEELARLEADLYAAEAAGDAAFDVADDLLVLRREDGSLFIGDVGFWRTQDPKGKRRSEIGTLLGTWVMGLKLPVDVATALRENILAATQRTVEYLPDFGPDPYFARIHLGSLQEQVQARDRYGLPVPAETRALLAQFA